MINPEVFRKRIKSKHKFNASSVSLFNPPLLKSRLDESISIEVRAFVSSKYN